MLYIYIYDVEHCQPVKWLQKFRKLTPSPLILRFNATIMTVASVLNHRHNTVQVAKPRTITYGVNGLEVRAERMDKFV